MEHSQNKFASQNDLCIFAHPKNMWVLFIAVLKGEMGEWLKPTVC